MKNIYREIYSLVVILLLAFLITGCGKKESASDSGSKETKKEETKQESKSNDSKKPESTISDSNTDVMINEYQDIVNEYVSVIKEVKNGNMTDMKKMQNLTVKMQSVATKLMELGPGLTEVQTERIKKIGEQAGAMMKQ